MIQLGFYKKKDKTQGPSYWKLNSGILENKDYKNLLEQLDRKKRKIPRPYRLVGQRKKIYTRLNEKLLHTAKRNRKKTITITTS